MKTDPQRSALFQLEKEFEGNSLHHKVKRSELVKLMNKVCAYYRVPVPRLKFAKVQNKEYGWTESTFDPDFEQTTITLNDAGNGLIGQNGFTLIHELAHHIIDYRFDDAESHGPEFAGVYMHLLSKYRFIPEDAFRVVARRWKIRIAREFMPGAIA